MNDGKKYQSGLHENSRGGTRASHVAGMWFAPEMPTCGHHKIASPHCLTREAINT